MTQPRTADEALALAAALGVRPWRPIALRNVLAYRKQRDLDQLDFVGEDAQALGELEHGATRGSVQYDFDADTVGGSLYLLAHRMTLGVRHDLPGVSLHASTSLRRRDYRQVAQAPFTGWVYGGDAGARVPIGTRVDVDAKLLGWRERTQDAVFATIAGGGQLAVTSRPRSRLRCGAQLAAWYATFDAPEPNGQIRHDVHVEGALDVEVDLGDHVLAIGGASAARNDSTVEDFRYWKIVARAGLAFAFGGL